MISVLMLIQVLTATLTITGPLDANNLDFVQTIIRHFNIIDIAKSSNTSEGLEAIPVELVGSSEGQWSALLSNRKLYHRKVPETHNLQFQCSRYLDMQTSDIKLTLKISKRRNKAPQLDISIE